MIRRGILMGAGLAVVLALGACGGSDKKPAAEAPAKR